MTANLSSRDSRPLPSFLSARHNADNLNKLKNVASKAIGEKMKVSCDAELLHRCVITSREMFSLQKKEPVGDSDALPDSVTSKLLELTKESCADLTVTQLKAVRALIDAEMEKNNSALEGHAGERDEALKEVANWVHDSVPVSQDEVRYILSDAFKWTCTISCS